MPAGLGEPKPSIVTANDFFAAMHFLDLGESHVGRLLLVLRSRGIRSRTFLQAQTQNMATSGPR